MSNTQHIIPQSFHLTREIYSAQYKHHSKVIWFTGLSGSGKSTLANELSKILFHQGIKVFVLDGDNTRLGINKDLGFSLEDRKENIRRVAEIARLFLDSGTVVMTSYISPIAEDREMARNIIGENDFLEIFIDCPIDVCEKRDIKGLYAKARSGQIKNFTGIDSPYEKPENPLLTIDSSVHSINQCMEAILTTVQPLISIK